jgi:tRNA(fMet)-specific endonuclease VapC
LGLILDSSVLIGAERGTLDMIRFLESVSSDFVAISAVTASELMHGCHRAPDPGTRARRSAFVDAILDVLPVVPFGLSEARRHAELWADLQRKGKMIGSHDLLIAATAIARGDSLATLNPKEFKRVAGLMVLSLDRFSS